MANIKNMPGVTAPLGFFDPVGFCEGASEGKIRFYREVELKHARVGMLAAVGFLVAENFHPLWGGNIDVPSYIAFQETPLQTFWPVVVTGMHPQPKLRWQRWPSDPKTALQVSMLHPSPVSRSYRRR